MVRCPEEVPSLTGINGASVTPLSRTRRTVCANRGRFLRPVIERGGLGQPPHRGPVPMAWGTDRRADRRTVEAGRLLRARGLRCDTAATESAPPCPVADNVSGPQFTAARSQAVGRGDTAYGATDNGEQRPKIYRASSSHIVPVVRSGASGHAHRRKVWHQPQSRPDPASGHKARFHGRS